MEQETPATEAGSADRETLVGVGDTRQGTETRGGRLVAFRVASVVVALWFLIYFSFALLEVGLMWLPEPTLVEVVGEDEILDLGLHRTHFMMIGVVAWALVLPALAHLRKPQRQVASMIQLMALAVGGTIVYGLSGTLAEWLLEEGAVLAPVIVLVVLHPRARDFMRRPGFDRNLLTLAVVGAVPWLVYLIDNARLQFTNAAGDTHAELEHWATAALLGVVMIVCSLIGASDHDGWRLPAWIASAGAVIIGVHMLVFPGLASGLSVPWAVVSVVWGIALAAATIRRARLGPVPVRV